MIDRCSKRNSIRGCSVGSAWGTEFASAVWTTCYGDAVRPFRTIVEVTSPNFRFWRLPIVEPSDILSTSHPSHPSLLTEVMCIKDGFFCCDSPADSGEAAA
jgi:hypothetical protein